MIEIAVLQWVIPLAEILIVAFSAVIWYVFADLIKEAINEKEYVLIFLAAILFALGAVLILVLLYLLALVNFV